MKSITLLTIAVFTIIAISCKKSDVTPGENNDYTGEFNPGLLWQTGLAPQPSIPIPAGHRAWYVNADAPDGGDGTEQNPYNSFSEVIGGIKESSGWNYVLGLLRGGDHLYVAGEFMSADGVDAMNIINCWRAAQGGTEDEPTLITTWPGKPRAIFNGLGVNFEDHYVRSPIHFMNGGFYKVENIEIKNGLLYGISAREGSSVEVVNCEIHHTHSTSGGGVGGGISISGWADCKHKIHNNLLYENRINTTNSGSITVLSEGSNTGDNVVEIYDNIIHHERTAIHHKHCGNVEFQVHHNLIRDCYQGVWNRAYRGNYYYENIFLNCTDGFISSRENMQGDAHTSLTKNTFINCPRVFSIENVDEGQFDDFYVFNENIIYGSTSPTIHLGYPSSNFDIARWSSARNIFLQSTGTIFLFHSNVDYSFNEGVTFLSDATSIAENPLLSDVDSYDFRLSAASPARGFAVNGEDIGALPYGSTYILELNRYTVQ